MKCTRCHIRESEPNRTNCIKCLEYRRKKEREYKQIRIAAGYCTRCTKNMPVPGHKHCQRCIDYSSRYNKHVSNNNRINGLCACGNELLNGKAHCKRCLQYSRDRHSKYKAAGLCRFCGENPEPGHAYCAKHIDFNNKRGKIRHQTNRQIVINHYGGKCFCCGLDIIQFLTIDHINNNGRAERNKHGSGSEFYSWLIRNNFPTGYRVACVNCNSSRGMHGYCPHHPEDRIIKTLCNTPRAIAHRIIIQQRRIKIINHYGGKCACCGEPHFEFLTVDHMNNDGAEHKRKIKQVTIDRWLVANNFPDGYQILCWNCNLARHFNGGICPHVDRRSYGTESNTSPKI